MIRMTDPGHRYKLLVLDGNEDHELRFVKRIGKKFPGNIGQPYAGTTLQSVLRCLIDRTLYLQGQKWCLENIIILWALKISIWCLEFRAARRHGKFYMHGLEYATTYPMCFVCGHTFCNCKEER
jgi:hypothetical protein